MTFKNALSSEVQQLKFFFMCGSPIMETILNISFILLVLFKKLTICISWIQVHYTVSAIVCLVRSNFTPRIKREKGSGLLCYTSADNDT